MSMRPLSKKQKIMLATVGVAGVGAAAYILWRRQQPQAEAYETAAPTIQVPEFQYPEWQYPEWQFPEFPEITIPDFGQMGGGSFNYGGSGITLPYTPPEDPTTGELSNWGKLFGYGAIGLAGLLGLGAAKKLGITGAISSGAKMVGSGLSKLFGLVKPVLGPTAAVTGAVTAGLYGLGLLPETLATWTGGQPEQFRAWAKPYAEQAPIAALEPLYTGVAVAKTAVSTGVTAWKRLLGFEPIPTQPAKEITPQPQPVKPFAPTFLAPIQQAITQIPTILQQIPKIQLPSFQFPSFSIPSFSFQRPAE